MLKPFNYVRGYARLNAHMSRHLRRDSQRRILQQLDRFRPQFRAAMQARTDVELVLDEMWIARTLMEYDRAFAAMAVPACCWRRTGEIVRGNREMAELLGVSWDRLRDGSLALHQFLSEDSLVSYWEKFGAIAFNTSQKAILTGCTLQRHDEASSSKTHRCCFSFTIRRDSHHMYVIAYSFHLCPRQDLIACDGEIQTQPHRRQLHPHPSAPD